MKRRPLAQWLLLLLLLSACQEKKEEAGIPAGAWPLTYIRHLYIGGMADSVPGAFVFDTGANGLYLDSTYYAGGAFSHANFLPARLPGAGTSLQHIRIIKDTVNFRFADCDRRSSRVAVMQLKPILGDYADGILGMDFFFGSVLEINYEREYYRLYPCIDSADLSGFTRIGLIKRNGRLFLPLEVQITDSLLIQGEFELDLGSAGSVTLTSPTAAKYDLLNRVKDKIPYYTRYGGVGGESSNYDFFAASVGLGGFVFDSVFMEFSNDRAGALSSEKYTGLLGNRIMERFDVVIDFINNDLYLRPNRMYSEAFRISRPGFAWADRSRTLGSWTVTGLYRDSQAEKSGLMIDDQILAVNEIGVKQIGFRQQKNYFDGLEEVRLLIKRNDRTMEICFRLPGSGTGKGNLKK
ncbi:MAG: hypothetical protein ACOYXB_06360 [Bacteroidota bacterium]